MALNLAAFASVQEGIKTLNLDIANNIINNASSTWDVSKLHSNDSGVITSLSDSISIAVDTYNSAIDSASKACSTVEPKSHASEDIAALYTKVTSDIEGYITDKKELIETASKAAWEEASSKYKAFQSKCESNNSSIQKRIDELNKLKSDYDDLNTKLEQKQSAYNSMPDKIAHYKYGGGQLIDTWYSSNGDKISLGTEIVNIKSKMTTITTNFNNWVQATSDFLKSFRGIYEEALADLEKRMFFKG